MRKTSDDVMAVGASDWLTDSSELIEVTLGTLLKAT